MNKTDQVNQGNQVIDDMLQEFKSFSSAPIYREELNQHLGDISTMSRLEIQKAIFMYFARRLKDNPEEHHHYDSDKITGGIWQAMTKLLTALRVQELKDVKVVRRKGKYDIKELRESYYGKKILQDLPELGKRWMLNKADYRKILLELKKLDLELPTEIEPTTTEKFFEGEL